MENVLGQIKEVCQLIGTCLLNWHQRVYQLSDVDRFIYGYKGAQENSNVGLTYQLLLKTTLTIRDWCLLWLLGLV